MGQVKQFPDFQGKSIGNARALIILGWVFAVISLFFVPLLFGILGVIMGIIASKRGVRSGKAVIIANIFTMLIGTLAGTILNTFLRMFLGVFLITNA